MCDLHAPLPVHPSADPAPVNPSLALAVEQQELPQSIGDWQIPDDPDRREVLAEIVERLRDGEEIEQISFRIPRGAAEAPAGPIMITVDLEGHASRTLDGLWQRECDDLRSSLLDQPWMKNGRNPNHEKLVVVTLATIIHQRGIRLDPGTVCYLHGEPVLFRGRGLLLPKYNRVRFAEAVAKDGWNVVADYLVEQQDDLLQQTRNGAANLQDDAAEAGTSDADEGTSEFRRGPGAPPKEERSEWMRQQYEVSKNLMHVARDAADRYENLSVRTAYKFGRFQQWYKKKRRPDSRGKTANAAPPAASPAEEVSMTPDPRDIIERHLRHNDTATTEELARLIVCAHQIQS